MKNEIKQIKKRIKQSEELKMKRKKYRENVFMNNFDVRKNVKIDGKKI